MSSSTAGADPHSSVSWDAAEILNPRSRVGFALTIAVFAAVLSWAWFASRPDGEGARLIRPIGVTTALVASKFLTKQRYVVGPDGPFSGAWGRRFQIRWSDIETVELDSTSVRLSLLQASWGTPRPVLILPGDAEERTRIIALISRFVPAEKIVRR